MISAARGPVASGLQFPLSVPNGFGMEMDSRQGWLRGCEAIGSAAHLRHKAGSRCGEYQTQERAVCEQWLFSVNHTAGMAP